jgi:hypothetical protein
MGTVSTERILRERKLVSGTTRINETVSRTDLDEYRNRLHHQIRGHLKALAKANTAGDEAARREAVAYINIAHDRLVALNEEINRR